MHKGFFAEALAHRPELFRAMLEANRLPATFPAREDAPPGSARRLADALWADPSGRAALQRVFFSRPADPAGAEERFIFWDYAEESRRLALLPPAALLRLARLFGVAIHAPAMAGVVRREAVLALRAELGEDLYRYALRRGQYQIGEVRKLFVGRDRDLSLGRRAALHGIQALAVCSFRWPAELRDRVKGSLSAALAADDPEARLPAAAAQPPAADRSADLPASGKGVPAAAFSPPAEWRDEAVIRVVWQSVKKLLIREVAPSWAPCFD